MIRRTWPYGSRRKAVVMNVINGRKGVIGILSDDQGEGHVLAAGAIEPHVKPGAEGEIIFTKGGPDGRVLEISPAMKTFCPKCHLECLVTADTGRSTCCDEDAFIGCDGCGKRLIQLSKVALGPKGPIECYSCNKKARKPKKETGLRRA